MTTTMKTTNGCIEHIAEYLSNHGELAAMYVREAKKFAARNEPGDDDRARSCARSSAGNAAVFLAIRRDWRIGTGTQFDVFEAAEKREREWQEEETTYYAIYQSGHGIFGTGMGRDAALTEAAEWYEGGREQLDADLARDADDPRVHGHIYLAECTQALHELVESDGGQVVYDMQINEIGREKLDVEAE